MSTSLWFQDPRTLVQNELRNFIRGGNRWGREDWNWPSGRQRAGVFPPVNIYDDGEGFRIRAEMPGVDKESLDISCKDDQIVIRGERVLQDIGEEANFHRQEREGGQFRRAVGLPQPVNPDKVMAEYNHGILNIFAPRAESAKPRKIEVR